MELLLNRKIYLDLTVKVRKKWTEKEEDLKRLGYSRK
jgi:GTPase Era involved in 16S rRNA processing